MRLTILDDIVDRVKQRVAADKIRRPIGELKKRIANTRPVVSFSNSISGRFGLIAEIKRRSPSQGMMRHQGIFEIAQIYQDHSLVRAVSVLTNRDDFDMHIEDLAKIRGLVSKPILRKDFIFDEYQVYEARAFGADAILLMANILTDQSRMRGLFDLSKELGMDVLFECRNLKEIDSIPLGAKIYGINSRKLKARKLFGFSRYSLARMLRPMGVPDRSIQFPVFDLVNYIPKGALKVAESGLVPREIGRIRDTYHYDSALIGTAILNATEGVKAALDAFSDPLHEGSFVVHDMIPSRGSNR